MGPTAPQYVRSNAVETGAFIDFEQIARLQRLMRGVRITLEQGYPRLPRGSVVVESNMPQRAIYAFGGDHALHVWYRDTTLRWSMMQSFVKHPEIPAVGAVEFETDSLRPFGLIDREALRHSARAVEFESAQKWAEARVELDAAEALQRDPRASTFRGEIVGERSLCLMALQQPDSAEREAFRALSICRENPNAHFTLAMARYKQGRLEEARLEAQQALIGATNPAGPRTLLAAIERRTQAH
jgi:tetratricopeptide (TPR) repeat protein